MSDDAKGALLFGVLGLALLGLPALFWQMTPANQDHWWLCYIVRVESFFPSILSFFYSSLEFGLWDRKP